MGQCAVYVTYQERCASFVSRAVAPQASFSAQREQIEQNGTPHRQQGGKAAMPADGEAQLILIPVPTVWAFHCFPYKNPSPDH